MTFAPACSTASTSSPSRAKSAERMDGAIQGCMTTSVLHNAAALADELIGLDDFLRPLLRMLEHRLGQAVRFELVGMMTAQLTPVRLDHLFVACARCDFEHLISRFQWRRAAARGIRRKAAATDAHHGFDL